MTSTRIISEADIIPDRSSGYRLVNGGLKNQEWVTARADELRPDDRLTIVVFTNLDENNSRPEDIAAEVAAIYAPALRSR